MTNNKKKDIIRLFGYINLIEYVKRIIYNGFSSEVSRALHNKVCGIDKETGSRSAEIIQDNIKEIVKDLPDDEICELFLDIYDKYYTHSDIKKIIAFHESEIGKKINGNSNSILMEIESKTVEYSKRISQEIAYKIIRNIVAKTIDAQIQMNKIMEEKNGQENI